MGNDYDKFVFGVEVSDYGNFCAGVNRKSCLVNDYLWGDWDNGNEILT